MNFIKSILKVLIIVVLIFILNYVRIIISYKLNKNKYIEFSEIYGNRNGYAPQGLTYSKKYDIILQTAYSKYGDFSILYVTNFKTGRLEKEIKLLKNDGQKNNNHVGGITTNDDKVWITSDYEINEYSLEEMVNTDKSYLKSLNDQKLYNRGDFCTYYDNILWIGEFFLNGIYEVKDNNPLLMGYNLSEKIDYFKPAYIISLPKMVQGMGITKDNKFVLTMSYSGLINSELVVYENILNKKNYYYELNGNSIKYYKFNNNSKIKTIKLPPMAEEFFIKDEAYYILFESGSDRYVTAFPKIDKIIKIRFK